MLITDAASSAALSTLDGFWFSDAFPVRPEVIAKRMGLKVSEARLDKDLSGFIIKRKGEDAEIYLEETDSRARRSFTCAHEIGHYIERVEFAPGEDEFGFIERRRGKQDIHEFYADEFAGSLLMPAAAVREFAGKNSDPLRVAAHFGVTLSDAANRLRRLEL